MALWIALTSESTQSVGGLEPKIDPLFGDCFWEPLWTFSLFRPATLSSSLLGPGTSDDADAPLELVCSSPSNVLLRFFTGSASPPVFLSSDSSFFCCCSVSLEGRAWPLHFLVFCFDTCDRLTEVHQDSAVVVGWCRTSAAPEQRTVETLLGVPAKFYCC